MCGDRRGARHAPLLRVISLRLFGFRALINTMRSSLSIRLRRVLTVASATMLPALLLSCGGDPDRTPDSDPAVPVEVAQVQYEARALPIRTSGILANKAELRLGFKIGGVILEIPAQEGQAVAAGQLLARLDPSEIDAQVAQAQIGFEKAMRDLDRAESLLRDTVATVEQVENARSARDAARAALDAAEFNRRFAEIRSPAAGRVLRRLAEPGELVASGAPVLVVGASGRGWVVRVALADRDIVRVRPGDHASLHFDAVPGESFDARIVQVAAAADPLTGTFEVELGLDRADERLRSGFIARVTLHPSQRDPYFFIPIEALAEGDGVRGVVYLLEPGSSTVRRRDVAIAHVLDDSIAVSSGLTAGALVVSRGTPYLSDSTRVQRINQD